MRSEAIINAVNIDEIQKNNREKAEENFSVPVIVDKDKDLNYEQHNWIIKIMRIPIVFLLNMLPASAGKRIFTAFSNKKCGTKAVSRWVTTYKALEVIYTYPERRERKEISATDSFWGSFSSNSRAVRNRLKLVKRELLTAIKQVEERKSKISLMSLGSGSARAVIETLAQLDGLSPVQAKLVDMSRKAISFSQELAASCNVNQKIEWHRDYAQNLERYCSNGFQPDIVEMVGLLDYYPYYQAVDLITRIWKVLPNGGWLITCNIRDNFERPFITKSLDWPMIYRSPQELADILLEAGFLKENIKVVYEPLKIHGLAIAQKLLDP